jgi:peroxiredoxin
MADDFKSSGVDDIICASVDDPVVAAAWANKHA